MIIANTSLFVITLYAKVSYYLLGFSRIENLEEYTGLSLYLVRVQWNTSH